MSDYPPMQAPKTVARVGRYTLARYSTGHWELSNRMTGVMQPTLIRALWFFWRSRQFRNSRRPSL